MNISSLYGYLSYQWKNTKNCAMERHISFFPLWIITVRCWNCSLPFHGNEVVPVFFCCCSCSCFFLKITELAFITSFQTTPFFCFVVLFSARRWITHNILQNQYNSFQCLSFLNLRSSWDPSHCLVLSYATFVYLDSVYIFLLILSCGNNLTCLS